MDREQAGQLCTKGSVRMQMTLSQRAGEEKGSRGSAEEAVFPLEDVDHKARGRGAPPAAQAPTDLLQRPTVWAPALSLIS